MRLFVCLFALLALILAGCEGHRESPGQAKRVSGLLPARTLAAMRELRSDGEDGEAPEPEVSEPAVEPGDDIDIITGLEEIDEEDEEDDDNGDDDDDDDEGECTSVVDIAVNAELNTLTAAVTAAELAETLGPDFVGTVFAPTEDAFAQLLKDLELTADELLANTELLTQVLLIHVVPEVVAFAADLEDGQEIPTAAEGVSVTVSLQDDGVFIMAPSGDEAQVITPDVEATCGAVVHVIDKVLTPA